jgi:hypothetical protein
MQIPVTLESPKDSVPSKIVAGSTPSKELTVSAEPLPANSDVRVRGNDDFQALILSDNGETAPASSQISVADRIRIVVPEKPFAAVYSYDTQGVLTQHWPMTGAFARPLPAGPLPHDWQADSLPHRETFVLVYSNASFPLDTNVQSLKQRLRTESTRLKRATFTLTCQP